MKAITFLLGLVSVAFSLPEPVCESSIPHLTKKSIFELLDNEYVCYSSKDPLWSEIYNYTLGHTIFTNCARIKPAVVPYSLGSSTLIKMLALACSMDIIDEIVYGSGRRYIRNKYTGAVEEQDLALAAAINKANESMRAAKSEAKLVDYHDLIEDYSSLFGYAYIQCIEQSSFETRDTCLSGLKEAAATFNSLPPIIAKAMDSILLLIGIPPAWTQ